MGNQTAMDRFCGSKFWDLNLTWHTEDPDLTDCFQKSVLFWIPCIFLWVFSTFEVYHFSNSKRRDVPVTWLFILKFVLNVTLILLSLLDLAKSFRDHWFGYEVFAVDYTTPSIKLITFISAIILLNYNRKYGMRTSGLLWIFWLLLSLCGVFQCRSLLRRNENKVTYEFISYMIYFPIVVLLLLLNFLVDAEPRFSDYPSVEKPCPEQSAAFPSRLTFKWFDSLAWRGFKYPLETKDLWSLNQVDLAKEIVPQFDEHWTQSFKKLKHVSVLIPLFKAFGPTFFFGTVFKVIQDIMAFISPLILDMLIDFTCDNKKCDIKESTWKGYFYVFLLLSTAVLQTFISAQYFHRMFLVGLRIKTALMAAIYKKVLRISNLARKESTVGEIVNLLSVDTDKLVIATPYLNLIWSAPFQILIALYLLWQYLGPSVLAGLAVMIILMPVNGVISKKVMDLEMKQMYIKDDRVKLINEVLIGIKVLKLYAWEPSFEEQILKIRNKEIKVLKESFYLNAGITFMWSCAPFIVSLVSFATFVLIDEKNVLDSKTAFVSLSLFNIMEFPLSILPPLIGFLVEASVSIKRINKFMNSEELDPNIIQHDESEVNPLVIEDGNFSWDLEDRSTPTLRNINLQIKQGQLVAVVGIVGSGKSSLISALLGEMQKLSGRINTKGSIAYVSQQAWIQNATLRDNILFGKTYKEDLYQKIIDACALTPDFEVLPGGDRTEIGEKGINLSGGQKQRVSLARAVYSDSDVYFLDDPLSAVDARVGKHIFDNLIGPSGLMKKKTRILVTHGISFLPEVDNIIVLTDGEISETGTYRELLAKRGAFADFLAQHSQEVKPESENSEDHTETEQQLKNTVRTEEHQRRFARARSRVSESSHTSSIANGTVRYRQNSTDSEHSGNSLTNINIKEKDQTQCNIGERLIETEEVETGSVKWHVYSHYFKSIGWFLVLSIVIGNVIFQSLKSGSNIWLSFWSTQNIGINGSSDNSKNYIYLSVYGALGIGKGVVDSLVTLIALMGSLSASKRIFEGLINRILGSPMSFFDTTPCGRILNRLAKDTNTVDNTLPFNLLDWIYQSTKLVTFLVVISYSTPMFMTVILPIGVAYFFIQRFYVATSRQLQRLESVSISPITSHLAESVAGVQTIRAYGEQDRFTTVFESKVDFNQSCYYPTIIADRWLTVRLEMVGNLVIFFAALFAVLNRDDLDSGKVGLSITYALQITQTLNQLVMTTSYVETHIVSIERIKEYSETPQEAAFRIIENDPPETWPQQGCVKFRDFKLRYRDGLDLVLTGLTFSVNGGEKVGIVGRTGAGKSSLTLALFRIIEPAGGEILIDDVDISKLGLHTLRSKLNIIPQDPVLFSGSLRLNLDPLNKCSDDDLWRVLDQAHLKDFVKNLPNGLNHEVTEGGDNFSVGQRQLICLARALLRKTKVLILDEATAAVDLETDDLIQRTIREQFKDCTILTIAHRLNTILDSDRVIVLDKGSILEYDSPKTLLQRTDSAFYRMAKEAGLTSV